MLQGLHRLRGANPPLQLLALLLDRAQVSGEVLALGRQGVPVAFSFMNFAVAGHWSPLCVSETLEARS